MADRWFYKHGGAVLGPVADGQLKQLAASGALLPTDVIWQEGKDADTAVEAELLMDFTALRQAKPAGGNWAGKVAETLATPKPAATNTTPDWLADLQQTVASQPTIPPEPIPAVPRPAPKAPVKPQGPAISEAATLAPGTFTMPKRPTHRPLENSPADSASTPAPVTAAASAPALFAPRLTLSGASSKGRVRDRNEDRFQTWQWGWNDAQANHDVALLIVADGMGGYQGGEMASSLTLRTIANQLFPVVLAGTQTDTAAVEKAIEQAITEANRVVFQQASSDARYKGMGATAAVVVIRDGQTVFGHVGDCRVYLHRAGQLRQLTEDHTMVARMVALGKLSPDEAANHPSRNEVTQGIGKRQTIQPSRANMALTRGDYLVVACDGLEAHVDKPAIQQVLSKPPVPTPHLAAQLVHMADEAGGSDNCTVIVAYFG